MNPALKRHEYIDVLRTYCAIYHHAETCRSELGYWPEFSLSTQRNALYTDCDETDPTALNPFDVDMTETQSLGMLYALHGAQFGSSLILRNLQKILPGAPLRYFSLGTFPEIWRSLVMEMDGYRDQEKEISMIVEGALTTFFALDYGNSNLCRRNRCNQNLKYAGIPKGLGDLIVDSKQYRQS